MCITGNISRIRISIRFLRLMFHAPRKTETSESGNAGYLTGRSRPNTNINNVSDVSQEVPPPPFFVGNFKAQTIAKCSSPLLEHRNGAASVHPTPFLVAPPCQMFYSLGSGPQQLTIKSFLSFFTKYKVRNSGYKKTTDILNEA